MSLALRIVIGWSIAIVVTIALWNLGFVLARRRQRALEAEGVAAGGDRDTLPRAPREATPVRSPAARRTPAGRPTGERPAIVRRPRAADRRRHRAG